MNGFASRVAAKTLDVATAWGAGVFEMTVTEQTVQ
jgi:hypothetical protein